MTTSDDYRPCAAIYPRLQRVRLANVKHVNLMTIDQALVALRNDHAAYVTPGDAEMVMAQWQRERGAA